VIGGAVFGIILVSVFEATLVYTVILGIGSGQVLDNERERQVNKQLNKIKLVTLAERKRFLPNNLQNQSMGYLIFRFHNPVIYWIQ
jgi:hypothetical protein